MSPNPSSQVRQNERWPFKNIIASTAGFLVGLVSGVILAIINVLTPQWINRPEVSLKYVEALPVATYKGIEDSLFSQFVSYQPQLESYSSDPTCFQQLMSNRISPRCEADITDILDSMMSAEERLVELYNEYSQKIANIDINQVSSIPRFQEGGDPLNEKIDFVNMLIGFVRATPPKNDPGGALALEHYFEQGRDMFLSEAERKNAYVSVLQKVRDEFESLDLDRQHGVRTGIVYFRLGVQNNGTADALITFNAKLLFGQSQLQLAPLGLYRRYMIVPKGAIAETLLQVNEEKTPEADLSAWKELVVKGEQEDYRIVLTEGGQEFSIGDELPITEDVEDELLPRAFLSNSPY